MGLFQTDIIESYLKETKNVIEPYVYTTFAKGADIHIEYIDNHKSNSEDFDLLIIEIWDLLDFLYSKVNK